MDTKVSDHATSNTQLLDYVGAYVFYNDIKNLEKFNDLVSKRLSEKYSFDGDLKRTVTDKITFQRELVCDGASKYTSYRLVCMPIENYNTSLFNKEIGRLLVYKYQLLGKLEQFEFDGKMYFQRELVKLH